jgi:hypothetical protein
MLGRLAFQSLSQADQDSYLRRFLVEKTGSAEKASLLLQGHDREELVLDCTISHEQAAAKLRHALEIAGDFSDDTTELFTTDIPPDPVSANGLTLPSNGDATSNSDSES